MTQTVEEMGTGKGKNKTVKMDPKVVIVKLCEEGESIQGQQFGHLFVAGNGNGATGWANGVGQSEWALGFRPNCTF